ncbi:hypothetical protein Syun_012948 [Stephania yunnanensis]|uniref:Uncharacterized protein n=1 Tax=Stephania yunnanensis TaxID=152371 RepID=A0AAP0K0D6_9MAGN
MVGGGLPTALGVSGALLGRYVVLRSALGLNKKREERAQSTEQSGWQAGVGSRNSHAEASSSLAHPSVCGAVCTAGSEERDRKTDLEIFTTRKYESEK